MDTAGVAGLERPRSAFVWEIPGKLVSIQVSHEAIERIRMTALAGVGRISRGRGAETGGILLGSAETDEDRLTVRIEDFEPVACRHAFGPSYVLSEDDRQDFERTLDRWRPASDRRIYAVGYCRSDTREDLTPGAEDLDVFATLFADAPAVVLLIRPRATAPTTGALFYAESGEIRPDSPAEFSIEPRSRKSPDAVALEPARRAPEMAMAGTDAVQDIAEIGLTSGPRRLAPRMMLLFTLAVMAFAAAAIWAVRQLPLPRGPRGHDPFSVSLNAREISGNLHLTWDRTSPAIGNASRAVLIISDGEQNRTLELQRTQLRHGSVIYGRVTNHVSFRLEVWFEGSKNTLSESCEFVAPQTEARP